jgi:hypothetical protein
MRARLAPVAAFCVFLVGLSLCVAAYVRAAGAEKFLTLSRRDGSAFTAAQTERLRDAGTLWTPVTARSAQVSIRYRATRLEVLSVNAAYLPLYRPEVQTGAFFNAAQDEKGLKLAVLSRAAAMRLFGSADCAGLPLWVDGARYTVSGVVRADEERVWLNGGTGEAGVITAYISGAAETARWIHRLGLRRDGLEVFDAAEFRAVLAQRVRILALAAGLWAVWALLRGLRKQGRALARRLKLFHGEHYLRQGALLLRDTAFLKAAALCALSAAAIVAVFWFVRFTPVLPEGFFRPDGAGFMETLRFLTEISPAAPESLVFANRLSHLGFGLAVPALAASIALAARGKSR